MKGIIGAITGDIIGSTREFYPIKTKDFELFTPYSRVTDDSILTLAVANWLCEDKNSQDVLIKNLQYFLGGGWFRNHLNLMTVGLMVLQ